jgi:hypothetical protein
VRLGDLKGLLEGRQVRVDVGKDGEAHGGGTRAGKGTGRSASPRPGCIPVASNDLYSQSLLPYLGLSSHA